MTLKIFTMTVRTLKMRTTRGSKIKCQTCSKLIKIGDSVVTKKHATSHHSMIRHESCARRVGLID